MKPLSFLALYLFSQLLLAADLQLDLPIRCTLGRDCFIQNYYDHDASAGWQDYACGSLAYDKHTGTDFRLKHKQQMQAGIAVLAAAPGTVQAVRDSEPDISIRDRPLSTKNPKEAGNGVRIAHGDGWETQYSHLRQGSIEVRPGQRVQAGDVLGQVGLSGKTEFPHVDFTVRKNGQAVDPFGPERTACGEAEKTLWSDNARTQLTYQPTAILIAGFADRVLPVPELQSGEALLSALPANAPAQAFHIEIMGVHQGDMETMRITAPDGKVMVERMAPIEKNQAVRQTYLGKRKSASNWPTGEYLGYYSLQRSGKMIAETTIKIQVNL